MRILILGLALQIQSLCCWAQTQESDKYYQIGIDYIARNNYSEALDAFKKCQELDGTKTTQHFNISNNWHHWIGFCYYKMNDINSAKHYSDFYKFKPYNRLQIHGLDSIYYEFISSANERDYNRALDYLNQVEDTLASKFGKNNIYLNKIWEAQASMHFGLSHFMTATNILTKIWEIYNDSIGPCYEWQRIGKQLIQCYAEEIKRDKAITVEQLDSNTITIRRDKTYETGLILMKDSITPLLLLPMKYRNIRKIDDRFLFITKDIDHHFIIDVPKWRFSPNIDVSSVDEFVTEINDVPVFRTGYTKFVDFSGRISESPDSYFRGIYNNMAKFELDSVIYAIPKDSIMNPNNKVKYVFSSDDLSATEMSDYYIQHIYNQNYIVVYDKTDQKLGLLKRTNLGIIQLLPCENSEILPIFDECHFLLKKEGDRFIFNSNNLSAAKISVPIDDNDFYLGDEDQIVFDWHGKKTLFLRRYRSFLVNVEGIVNHLPIGSWVEKGTDGKYYFHYGEDFVIDINKIQLGKMVEFRIKHNNGPLSNWRFSARMDYPTEKTKLANNVRCWMSNLLSSTDFTYVPTDRQSPNRMLHHYAYTRIDHAKIDEAGHVIYPTERDGKDSIEYHFRQEDYDAFKMWEDDNYVTYVCGDAWYGGGPHGDSFTYYSTFSKETGELVEAKDLFSVHVVNQVRKLLYNLIIQEQIKRTESSEGDVLSNFEFTQENCPIGRLALSPKGVVFQYRAYELGGYNLGCFSFTIPYEKLNNIMNLTPMSPASKNVFVESLQNANKTGELLLIDLNDQYDRQSISFINKKYGQRSGEYLNFILQAADECLSKNDYVSSIKFAKVYSDLAKSIMPSRWTTNQGLIYIFKCYLKNKDYENAKEIGMDLLKQYNETHYMNEMLDRYDYSQRLSDIANIYFQIGKPDSALFYQEKSIYYGSEYEDELYKNASIYAYKCNQLSKACKFAYYLLPNKTSKGNWMNTLINNFKEATAHRRIELRNNQIPWYQNFLPDLAFKTNDSVIVECAYNAQLLSKNLLLNTEQSLRGTILSSQDTTLINPYLKIQYLKKRLVSIANDKSLDNAVKEWQTESVKEEMSTLESLLINKTALYGDYIRKLKIDIEQIKNYLKEGEIAIEFAISSDSIYYALVLDRNNTYPKIIKLCTAKDLISNMQHVYEMVWEPLMPSLNGINTIYFSPAGELYNIPIEYTYNNEDKCLNEIFQLYRLSSTREIVISRDSTYTSADSTNGAVLYGYLDYYADNNYKTIIESAQNNNVLSNIVSTNFSKRGRGLRANVGRLEYSKDEIHIIDSLIVSTHYADVDAVYENTAGTETSLKEYSRKQMRILHLATHGFYIPKSEIDNYKDYDFLSLENAKVDEIEDRELVRSGLLFAGANHTLEGDGVIPDGCDDGILTALEVASLDFVGLDLVVLSACQTAQGDLGEDGILGLQRGFKKAGANSILMSLWKVDDRATQILMTQFYKHLVSGQSKRQSLQSAQKELKEYNAGQFSKPEYWAAFILLDGIN